jgi:hypothetical protein
MHMLNSNNSTALTRRSVRASALRNGVMCTGAICSWSLEGATEEVYMIGSLTDDKTMNLRTLFARTFLYRLRRHKLCFCQHTVEWAYERKATCAYRLKYVQSFAKLMTPLIMRCHVTWLFPTPGNHGPMRAWVPLAQVSRTPTPVVEPAFQAILPVTSKLMRPHRRQQCEHTFWVRVPQITTHFALAIVCTEP